MQLEWIQYAMDHPIKEEIQVDGRVRRWANIAEADDKNLRVIRLKDRETVHNAFLIAPSERIHDGDEILL